MMAYCDHCYYYRECSTVETRTKGGRKKRLRLCAFCLSHLGKRI